MSMRLKVGGVVFVALIQNAAASHRYKQRFDPPALSKDALTEESSHLLARSPGEAGPGFAKKLPTVEAVMSKAKGKLSEFSKDKAQVEVQVVQKQHLRKRVLEAWKAKYETKLAAQVAQVRGIVAQSQTLKERLSDLEKRNEDIRASISNIRSNNGLMREALETLLPKMDMAHEFVQDAMNLTDDEQAAALKLLEEAEATEVAKEKPEQPEEPTNSAGQIEQAIRAKLNVPNKVVSLEAGLPGLSLMQARSEAHLGRLEREALALDATLSAPPLQPDYTAASGTPAAEATSIAALEAAEDVAKDARDELLRAFGEGDQALSDADEESHAAAARLKADFLEKYQKARTVKDRLIEDQLKVNATCKNLAELGADLLTAQDFLKLQGHHLAEHLQVLKGFMDSVNSTASAFVDTPQQQR